MGEEPANKANKDDASSRHKESQHGSQPQTGRASPGPAASSAGSQPRGSGTSAEDSPQTTPQPKGPRSTGQQSTRAPNYDDRSNEKRSPTQRESPSPDETDENAGVESRKPAGPGTGRTSALGSSPE
jgi:hypothetical protein